MLSMHFAMNLDRSLSLSPVGSFARRSAARRRSSFVGTWRCCWRFRIRNCLKASWSEGPVSRSASSWPLAAIRGAMGGGHWAAYERVRRGSRGCRARRRGCRATGAACDTGTDCRREIPNDTPLAEPLSQRSMGPPAGRSGWVDACAPRATRTKASGGKALASQAGAAKAGNDGSLINFD